MSVLDRLRQHRNNVVTGVDVVDGKLTFRRYDGSRLVVDGGGGAPVFRDWSELDSKEFHAWREGVNTSVSGYGDLSTYLDASDDQGSGDVELIAGFGPGSARPVVHVGGIWRFKYDIAIAGIDDIPYQFDVFVQRDANAVKAFCEKGPGFVDTLSVEGIFPFPLEAEMKMTFNIWIKDGIGVNHEVTQNELTLSCLGES